MLTIDGTQGEGGGQILRSALALSLVSGLPFRIENIRGGRKRPGLGRQHLTAVEAAASVGRGDVEGACLGSLALTFRPRTVVAGDHAFDVGSAGSATLVLQTVLPALLTAKEPSTLRLEGGTHNPFAPPYDFLALAFVPLVNRMGPRAAVRLERPGFYPAGGGRLEVSIDPVAKLEGLELMERGEIRRLRATATVARLPASIAERELKVLRRELAWKQCRFERRTVTESRGPGNVVTIEIESEHLTEVVSGFGIRGVRAELVAAKAAGEARRYLDSGVPVGPHLADQLMLPLALAGAGRYRTTEPSRHTTTQAQIIGTFLDAAPVLRPAAGGSWEVLVG